MIEKLIVTGLINSKEYTQQIRPVWLSNVLLGDNFREIARWCLSYYDEFKDVPKRSIEDIYYEKKGKKEIPKNMIESISQTLIVLADAYDEIYNVKYALERTQEYFQLRHLEEHNLEVQKLIDAGDVDGALYMQSIFKPFSGLSVDDLDLSSVSVLLRVENAFKGLSEALIKYPPPLGEILNQQMVRGAFVGLMASEKRGKSFWLLDMAIRATTNKCKVAFFQAGDMTESQQLKRIASYLTKTPINEKYIGDVLIPQADCIYNQLDECDLEERKSKFGIFTGGKYSTETIRKEIDKETLVQAHKDFSEEYKPCTNCKNYTQNPWGVPWFKTVKITHALTVTEAKKKIKEFFIDKKRRFRLSTHPNNTLTVSMIKGILNQWENNTGFVPDVIVIDYADLLVAETTKEFRHQQNEIWKNLRALSQERNCLVLTATQADAKSYEKDLLTMVNYSEDKRKYAHVTAMYGLNQDKNGREKKLGIMRINELVIREGEFDSARTVTVLQNLNIGRPFIDSYL